MAVAEGLVCFIVSMHGPFFARVEAINDPQFIFWEGPVENRGPAPSFFPYRQVTGNKPWESEIILLDGRAIKFGKEPKQIDCPSKPCDDCQVPSVS